MVFLMNKTSAPLRDKMDIILKANYNVVEEAMKMDTPVKSLEEIMEKTGFVARVEARGEERKALNVAKKMINLGLPIETIVSATDLDPEKVKELYQG